MLELDDATNTENHPEIIEILATPPGGAN